MDRASSARFDVLKDNLVEPQAMRHFSEQEMSDFTDRLATKLQLLREETDLFRNYAERTTQGKGFKNKEKDQGLHPKESTAEPEPQFLTWEQKSDIASHEADELKQELIRIEEKAKEYADKYECKIRECEQFHNFIHQQETYFRHKVIADGDVSAERYLKWTEDSIKNLESIYRATLLSNTAYQHTTRALEATLRKQEELGENLTQVDFQKIDIENMLLVQAHEQCRAEIQETNRENNKTSLAIANLSQQSIDLSKFLSDGQAKIQSDLVSTKKLEKEREGIDETRQKLEGWNHDASERKVRCPSISVYIQIERDLELLDQLRKESNRKLEILETAARLRARNVNTPLQRYMERAALNGKEFVDGVETRNYEVPIVTKAHTYPQC